MDTNLANILILLEHYKYILIFPIMVVEGPIISVISGFLVYLGFINIYIIYPLLVLGDLIGDSVSYSVGRYSKNINWIQKTLTWFGYNENSEAYLKNHFKKHTIKTLFLAKFSHGFGIPVQITAGIANVEFPRYFLIQTIGTMIKTIILLVIGFYLGGSYITINTYLDNIALVVSSIFIIIIIYLLFNRYVRKYFKNKENNI